MADAFAPASFIACATLANTGRSKCVWPAFFGLVPPITFVPVVEVKLSFWHIHLGFLATYRTRLLVVRGSWIRVSKVQLTKSLKEGIAYVPCFPVKP